MRAFHFLRDDFTASSGTEPPWAVGEERTCKGKLALCSRGYHSSPTWYDALGYATGNIACIVEISEPEAKDNEKQVSRTRKLVACKNVERELRLWGCDCAERALQRERDAGREPAKRSWGAIAVARRFAGGEATREELVAAWAAARAAAWAAAGDARAAARAAEMEWQKQHLAELLDAAVGAPVEECVI